MYKLKWGKCGYYLRAATNSTKLADGAATIQGWLLIKGGY